MAGPHSPSSTFLIVAFVLVLGEMIWRRMSGKSYDFGALGASVALLVGQMATSVAGAAFIVGVWSVAYDHAPVQWDIASGWTWLGCFLLVEFVYYWEHRLSHEVRWLWATHAVHHSPREFVLPAAFRLGLTGLLSGGWLFFAVVALAGFPPAMIGLCLVGGLRYQFFLHTESVGRLGPLDRIFNTPSNHRVHHSARGEYLDKNFGNVLMIFDHLFGTYARERLGTPMHYGLTDPIAGNNPVLIAFREWKLLFSELRGATALSQAVAVAFGRPAGRQGDRIKPTEAAEGVG